tara:strand:+ start:736 stop:1299 length:564 start_codon:yes stop_codon:yes gene_type:complete
MNSKKIIINENKILFKILDEIKDNFDFDLINIDSKTLKSLKINKFSDLLITFNDDEKNDSSPLVLKNFPIKLEKLIELINIQFLKNKFNLQSEVNVGKYKLNMNSREMIKGNDKLNLTEREINLIIFLFETDMPARIDKLQKEVWDYNSELETHTVETHIYRLRKKIKDKFKDNNFILSFKDGYKIN